MDQEPIYPRANLVDAAGEIESFFRKNFPQENFQARLDQAQRIEKLLIDVGIPKVVIDGNKSNLLMEQIWTEIDPVKWQFAQTTRIAALFSFAFEADQRRLNIMANFYINRIQQIQQIESENDPHINLKEYIVREPGYEDYDYLVGNDWLLGMVAGLPQTGKSTIVDAVAASEDVLAIKTDPIRGYLTDQTPHANITDIEIFIGRCAAYRYIWPVIEKINAHQTEHGKQPLRFIIDGTNMDKRLISLFYGSLPFEYQQKCLFMLVDVPPIEVVKERILNDPSKPEPGDKKNALNVHELRRKQWEEGDLGWQFPEKEYSYSHAKFILFRNFSPPVDMIQSSS